MENNEPDVFKKTDKWLDICDYLVLRCTGRFVRTADSAFATFMYDTRKGKEGWNKGLVKMYRMMADITGRTVETVVNAQEVGATGTALVVAAGIQGADVHELSRRFVKVNHTYTPDRGNKKVYERNYKVFKKLYKSNARISRL